MRRNNKSSPSLLSLGSSILTNRRSHKSKSSQRENGGFPLPFYGIKKGSAGRVKSSVSLVSLDGTQSSSDDSIPTGTKKSSIPRRSKSTTSLKNLGRETSSSPSSFSHLATPSAILILEELDESLQEIGQSYFAPRSRSISSKTICELSESEYDSDFSFPTFDGDHDSSRTMNNSMSSPQQTNHIKRVHRTGLHSICKIGRGAHSDVHMVLDPKREKCAMKALNPSRLKTSEDFTCAALDLAMEAKILSELDHENIIRLRGICSSTFSTSYTNDTDEGGYFLVLELLNDVLIDSLDRWRKQHKKSASWTFGKSKANTSIMYGRMERVALGIVTGMVYLHEHGIVIRDLKPANVGFDEGGTVRLFDFDMARKLEDCDPDEICGSPRYMPPEVMSGKGYSFEADVYSFGIILYEICSLNVAFNNIRKYPDRKEFNRLVIEQNMRPNLNDITCPLTTKLIEDCWQGDPTQRPSFAEIYKRITDITSFKNNEAPVPPCPRTRFHRNIQDVRDRQTSQSHIHNQRQTS